MGRVAAPPFVEVALSLRGGARVFCCQPPPWKRNLTALQPSGSLLVSAGGLLLVSANATVPRCKNIWTITCWISLIKPSFSHLRQSTGPGVPDEDFNSGSSVAMTYFSMFLDKLCIRHLLPSALGGKARYSQSGKGGLKLPTAGTNPPVVSQLIVHDE